MQVGQTNDLAYKLVEYQQYSDVMVDSVNSIFAPYQLAVQFAIHPLSDKYRFLVNHSTGSGKTITSLLVAKNFLNYSQRVYIITFNQKQFLQELLNIPELGFVTHQQLQVMQGHKDQVAIIQRQIIKKINKQIVFMGYKELFLTLFSGGNKLNMELVNRFQGSLVICDEIHNIYNNLTKNSYGVSIQILSYVLGKQVHMLYLSATPLNYSNQLGPLLNIMQVQNIQQDQVVELIERLESQNIFTVNTDIDKGKIFDSLIDNLKQSVKVTKENASQLIQQIFKNNVSFIPEIKKDFPESIDHGVEYKAIQHIKIKKCNITSTFKEYMNQQDNYLEGKECKKSILIHPTLDITEVIEKAKRSDPEIIKWMISQKMQLVQSLIYPTITGPYLKAENIGNYSPKLGFLISELLQINTKSFVYVNKVQGFGIDLIVELFKVNGILLFDTNPANTSICFKCKRELRYHEYSRDITLKPNYHEFVPYRAIVITGQNVSQGEEYLTRFNSIENHVQLKYQIVLGNVKIKESYNIMEVNNSYILTLPYNITNYIQVLGRCARNKSHINMPKQLQYVNNYLLVTTIEQSENLSSNDFQHLNSNLKNSQFYGKITREELDIWDKSIDFKQVQEYEQLIHSQSIDIKYFYPLYLKAETNPNNDSILMLKSNNMLKMLPFQIENSSRPKDIPQDLLTNHKDFDLSNFFLMNISSIINKTISTRLKRLFEQQSIWELNKLIDAILSVQQPPNLSIVPIEIIQQKIFTNKNTYIVNNFVIFSNTQPSMNFFLQGFVQSPLLSLQICKQDHQPINQQQLVYLYMYLQKHFQQYIDYICDKRIPVQNTNNPALTITNAQYEVIFTKLQYIFGNTSLAQIRQQYDKMIKIYNQQRIGTVYRESQANMFIACVNFILPVTFEYGQLTFSTQNTSKRSSKSQQQEVSNSIKKTNSNVQFRNIILTGYIVDLNTQIYISLSGDPSTLQPQRDLIFPNIVNIYHIHKKQLKIIKLQQKKNTYIKQSGFNCMNLDKDTLKEILKKPNLSKQEHCDLILKDSLQRHFVSIMQFEQHYRILFNFIDQ